MARPAHDDALAGLLTDEAREITDLPTLYKHLTLVDVETIEFCGRQIEASDEEEPDIQLVMRSSRPADGAQFFVALTLHAEGHGAEYSIGLEVHYEVEGGVTWTDDLEIEFVRRSAFITLAPYLRQALRDLGSRISRPSPWLPIQGDHSPETLEITIVEAPTED